MRFFFHMPKTAGGTLVRGIMRNAQVKWPLDPHYPRPLALPALSPAAQVWLGGHSAFGLHLLYNAEPTYITILREPVERLIPSSSITTNTTCPACSSRTMRLFRRSSVTSRPPRTSMPTPTCFPTIVSPRKASRPARGPGMAALILLSICFVGVMKDSAFFPITSFQRVDINDAFRKASNNVHAMHFIGFFDRLDETVAYLSEDFGLNVSLDAAVHQTKWKPKTEDLPGHIQAMLKRKTEADREFYDSVRRHSGLYQGEKFDRIEKQLSKLGCARCSDSR